MLLSFGEDVQGPGSEESPHPPGVVSVAAAPKVAAARLIIGIDTGDANERRVAQAQSRRAAIGPRETARQSHEEEADGHATCLTNPKQRKTWRGIVMELELVQSWTGGLHVAPCR